MCEYPQGPEEEVGSPRAGVAGSCGLPAVENMGAGEGGCFPVWLEGHWGQRHLGMERPGGLPCGFAPSPHLFSGEGRGTGSQSS